MAQASFPSEGNYESSVSGTIPLWGLLPVHINHLKCDIGRENSHERYSRNRSASYRARKSRNAAPVTAGQVNFCDASAPHCTRHHIVGSAALNSSGTAAFKFVPAPARTATSAIRRGWVRSDRRIQHYITYVGPAPNPVYSDTIAITSDGIRRRLQPYGECDRIWRPASPTGAVSFVDTSFSNNVLKRLPSELAYLVSASRVIVSFVWV